MKPASVWDLACIVVGVTAEPKVLLCSDSTASDYSPPRKEQGWGYFLKNYMSIPVLNLARGGRSTRTFIAEGLWASLLNKTAPGDFVIIEMGHNDAGDPKGPNDRKPWRSTLKGLGEETVTVQNGITTAGENGPRQAEVVHTFGWYLRKMTADVKKRNAIAIISSRTASNNWSSGSLESNFPFSIWAKEAAKQAEVEFVDHTKYSVGAYRAMGKDKASTHYVDITHTNPAGAKGEDSFYRMREVANYSIQLMLRLLSLGRNASIQSSPHI